MQSRRYENILSDSFTCESVQRGGSSKMKRGGGNDFSCQLFTVFKNGSTVRTDDINVAISSETFTQVVRVVLELQKIREIQEKNNQPMLQLNDVWNLIQTSDDVLAISKHLEMIPDIKLDDIENTILTSNARELRQEIRQQIASKDQFVKALDKEVAHIFSEFPIFNQDNDEWYMRVHGSSFDSISFCKSFLQIENPFEFTIIRYRNKWNSFHLVWDKIRLGCLIKKYQKLALDALNREERFLQKIEKQLSGKNGGGDGNIRVSGELKRVR